MNSQHARLPFIPYKEIGKFCGEVQPVFYSMEHHHYMALPTGSSFKVGCRLKRY